MVCLKRLLVNGAVKTTFSEKPPDPILFHLKGPLVRLISACLIIAIITAGSATFAFSQSSGPRSDDAIYSEFVQRGRSAGKTGDLELALSYFNRAIKLNPQDSRAYYYRCIVRCDLGQLQKAIRDCTRSLDLSGPSVPIHMHYNQRGLAYHRLGQLDLAIRDYSRAIDIFPGHWKAWANRGLAYRDKDQFQEALANLEQADVLNPNHPDLAAHIKNVKQKIQVIQPVATVSLSKAQREMIDDLGWPQAFTIMAFKLEDGRQSRYEKWLYFDQETAFIFVDGKYVSYEPVPPLADPITPTPFRPDQFPLGVRPEDLQRKTDVKQWKELEFVNVISPKMRGYLGRQLMTIFEDHKLIMAEAPAAVPRGKGASQ